ncbi:hypothetical protein T265_08807 [Opisthorchis viverrini]|uniref:Uncharacterized protein n=1 Tax=Opisthorchis viverrini TaxID=6198 RepID=A0A074ZCF0_OPIVI|nr:hypothetical protein T265_08807 [Opisthorchis viverrini]KER23272.1 hypothetical protein T265_08807 [Opisthorchis viverrini]
MKNQQTPQLYQLPHPLRTHLHHVPKSPANETVAAKTCVQQNNSTRLLPQSSLHPSHLHTAHIFSDPERAVTSAVIRAVECQQ